jgi:hypothetical protein
MSESVFLNLVEERFVTDAEIVSSLTLVTGVRFECAKNFLSFDNAQRPVRHFRQCSREIELA